MLFVNRQKPTTEYSLDLLLVRAMPFESLDILAYVEQALKAYKKSHKTPIIHVSYDGDGDDGSVIIDVEEHNAHDKSVARQSFIISSVYVKEIPYEEDEPLAKG